MLQKFINNLNTCELSIKDSIGWPKEGECQVHAGSETLTFDFEFDVYIYDEDFEIEDITFTNVTIWQDGTDKVENIILEDSEFEDYFKEHLKYQI